MADEPLRRALRDANAELLLRIEELSFVRLVGDALAGAVEPAAIGRGLIALLCDELRADVAALWVTDDFQAGLRLAALGPAGEGLGAADDAGALVPFTAGALGEAGAGTPVLLADVSGTAANRVPAEMAGMGAILLHPVGARGRTTGVIGLGAVDPAGVGPEHARLLGLVAPVVGMALENAALYGRLASENHSLRAELGQRRDAPALVGVSPAFRQLTAAMERLAEVEVTVLITGPSGTGKEVVARALHQRGRRGTGPFVAINCAALPETLLESELFGIERGVATGVERRPGLVERAHGGTLFLDEVGDMSPAAQARMLRVLQEREVTRVGGARGIPVDVRVIAATNRDLAMAVREGCFREDLYFRLKVVTLVTPSLAERVADVPLLAQHFLARFAAKHERADLRLAPEALAHLIVRPWPGNVRELENAIERAVVMTQGSVIGPDEIDEESAAPSGDELGYHQTVDTTVASAERSLIERALAATGANRTHAARMLGIGRRTLLYKLKRYGLS
jgi:DNA-binding NtrC family response regulator